MIKEALFTTGAVGAMGIACGGALAMAAKFFGVNEDPKVEAANELLPGANCGGCGYAGCADYAKAVVEGVSPTLCAPGGADLVAELSKLLGVEAEAGEPQVAIVLCAGDATAAKQKFSYNGIADCGAAATTAGGDKVCNHGCLGYGSCIHVCPVNAIEITEQGIAKIHPDICIACGKCIKGCPRNVIQMVPRSADTHVMCNSSDKGPITRKACSVGCIGCRMCTKLVKSEAFVMEGFLARRNYKAEIDNPLIIEKCPGKCIVCSNMPVAEPEKEEQQPTEQTATS